MAKADFWRVGPSVGSRPSLSCGIAACRGPRPVLSLEIAVLGSTRWNHHKRRRCVVIDVVRGTVSGHRPRLPPPLSFGWGSWENAIVHEVDQLQAELPPPRKADPNAAAALQELLGGKYGEMSTLGNYMFQLQFPQQGEAAAVLQPRREHNGGRARPASSWS